MFLWYINSRCPTPIPVLELYTNTQYLSKKILWVFLFLDFLWTALQSSQLSNDKHLPLFLESAYCNESYCHSTLLITSFSFYMQHDMCFYQKVSTEPLRALPLGSTNHVLYVFTLLLFTLLCF